MLDSYDVELAIARALTACNSLRQGITAEGNKAVLVHEPLALLDSYLLLRTSWETVKGSVSNNDPRVELIGQAVTLFANLVGRNLGKLATAVYNDVRERTARMRSKTKKADSARGARRKLAALLEYPEHSSNPALIEAVSRLDQFFRAIDVPYVEPITEKQTNFLVKLGKEAAEVSSLSKEEASQLIDKRLRVDGMSKPPTERQLEHIHELAEQLHFSLSGRRMPSCARGASDLIEAIYEYEDLSRKPLSEYRDNENEKDGDHGIEPNPALLNALLDRFAPQELRGKFRNWLLGT